jgi:hypothetical protein
MPVVGAVREPPLRLISLSFSPQLRNSYKITHSLKILADISIYSLACIFLRWQI